MFSWICAFWKVPTPVWEHLPWNMRGYWSLFWANLFLEEPFIHHLKKKKKEESTVFFTLYCNCSLHVLHFPGERQDARRPRLTLSFAACSAFLAVLYRKGMFPLLNVQGDPVIQPPSVTQQMACLLAHFNQLTESLCCQDFVGNLNTLCFTWSGQT